MLLRPGFSRKLTVASFVLAIFLIWLAPAVFADVVNVTLVIKVTDENGNPVSKAQISIPRQGRNTAGRELREIRAATDDTGKYQKLDSDFQLTGTAHKVIVTAGDLTVEEALSDQQLRDAASKAERVLLLPITLKPPKKPRSVNISATVTDVAGKPVKEAEILLSARNTPPEAPSFESTAKSGSDGRFQFQNVEFEPGDLPRILKISATGFEDYQLNLANEMLVKNGNNTLLLNPIILKVQPSRFEQIKNALNWFFWIVGLITVLMLGIVLVNRTRRWWAQRNNQGNYPQTELTTEELVKNISRDLKELKNSTLTEAKLVPILSRSLDPWLKKMDQQNLNSQQDDNAKIPEDGTPAVRESPQSRVPQNESIRDFKCRAQQGHHNLINKIPDDLEPVYLDVEGPRSMAGKLEDKTVYLKQVNHSNAALVLFTENNAGWLFPNPKLAFSRAAVKDVFLDLTEEEYKARKAELEPMPAVRVDDGRWKLASS